jgi:endonuclease G
MSKRSQSLTRNIILTVTGCIIFSCFAIRQNNTGASQNEAGTENLSDNKIEIPAKITGRQEQIIEHIAYTVSYNSDWKIPNWVAYELTGEEVAGIEPRGNHFIPDPEVPFGKSATTGDYKNSGWDRGHMAPAGDMKWSKQAMKESFYLSNICPQNKNLNSGIWKDLEEQIRSLAVQKGRIYVVCGPIVSKQPKTIGANKVAIPDAFFKVLLQKSDEKYANIAFLFANESGRKPLSTYAMSVKEMQIITDIDFFPALPDSIENVVENRVDFMEWTIDAKK